MLLSIDYNSVMSTLFFPEHQTHHLLIPRLSLFIYLFEETAKGTDMHH